VDFLRGRGRDLYPKKTEKDETEGEEGWRVEGKSSEQAAGRTVGTTAGWNSSKKDYKELRSGIDCHVQAPRKTSDSQRLEHKEEK